MKNRIIRYGVFFTALVSFVSCKDKEAETAADERIAALESYVDSLENVKTEDAEANWEQISADYDRRTAESNEAIATLGDDIKPRNQARLDSINARYFVIRTSVETAKVPVKVNPNQALRDTFFGAGKLGEDMNFSWVNKDNILDTYQTFFDAYKNNKENFTREDYDEVKLIYEALDSRKNTVEKEGLSSEDNTKIASIKFKFAPMFKMNRIGAKARENEEAKE
ncbi:hypothetical protein [Flavobacterium sp.]|uniref:hypothetical protein n=1 Tax=Flavobacterium sp. TaxID=239 RepID=UPI00391DC365